MKRSHLALAALVGLAFVVLAFSSGDPEADRPWMARASTYSPGPPGAKAFYLLLRQLGLDAARLRRSDYETLPTDTVLWVLTPEPFGRVERRSLVHFLQRGGRLVAPPRALAVVLEEAKLGRAEQKEERGPVVTLSGGSLDLDGPAVSTTCAREPVETYATSGEGVPVVAAWNVGEGLAVSLGVDEITRNDLVGRGANGPFLVRLALALGKTHVFDESKTGFGEGDLFTLMLHVPYRWGIAQLALVGAVGLFALARRRFPAEPPAQVRRRRTLEHVEAVARLWHQAGDAGLALHSILSAAAERARVRMGGMGQDHAFVEWIERTRPELAPRAKKVWDRAMHLGNELRPSPEAARLVAADINCLEQDAMRW